MLAAPDPQVRASFGSFYSKISQVYFDVVGVGDEIHNFVYRFAPWNDLGCWRDTGDGRTMKLLANFRMKINWFHMEKTGTFQGEGELSLV